MSVIDLSNGANLLGTRVRELSAQDLGYSSVPEDAATSVAERAPLSDDDPYLIATRRLLTYYGGVIFSGPPGTGKTYYAHRIALSLAEEAYRVRFVQFHPAYQYEDFVEGYRPEENGSGFTRQSRHLLQMCEQASRDRENTYVIVIDELSRTDPSRVFGEALTYVEQSKRCLEFSLASGHETSIPPNLKFVATMNSSDRGVDGVDAAFDRRFARIAFEPDSVILSEMLTDCGMHADLRQRVARFFEEANRIAEQFPYAALGQSIFQYSSNEEDLHMLWSHQLRFHFERVYFTQPDKLTAVKALWNQIFDGTSIADQQTTVGE